MRLCGAGGHPSPLQPNTTSRAYDPRARVFTSYYYTSPFEVQRCDQEYAPTPATCNAGFAADDALFLAVDLDAYYVPSLATREVLLLMGDDFTFESGGDYFNYMDALIAALNAHPSGRYTAFYSTPSDYIAARLAETSPATPLEPLLGDMMVQYMRSLSLSARNAFFPRHACSLIMTTLSGTMCGQGISPRDRPSKEPCAIRPRGCRQVAGREGCGGLRNRI